ncbi:hypothetical protein Dsin_000903 [Dipteronia sinensis]|uniref:Uncharacterized protein n=1 Tax=Dipteronia sinensis TaxID=43782 RepID=A0AAE0B3A6_9ROSI|nr:hypothetical protein Dsin_000903 [Dipteronia sinensis]
MLCKLEIDECKRFVCRCPTGCKSLTSMSLSNISDFGNLLRQEFQEVECLNIKGCEELIHLWQTNICLERPRRGLHSLTSLRELYIGSCGTLTSVPEEIKLSSAHLEKLQIEDCHSLTFIFTVQLPPSLKRLDVRNCEKLMCLFDDENEDNSSTCSSTSSLVLNENVNNTSTSLLEYLGIEKCPSLTCLSTTGELPATLTRLLIKDCSKLVTLSSIGQLPTHLKDLEIKKCSELKTILSQGHLPETLETLNIKICPKLEFIVERFQNNRALNDIRISNCTNLKAIPEGLHTFSSLRIFYIWDCPSLDSLIEGGFPNTNLSVWLVLCKKLKGLPSSLHNLTSLQGLFLYGCPRIPFPEEGFPTNLASLSIEGLSLYKPLSEWGLHKLTSLRYLHIWGCPDAVSFPEENMRMELPTTLTELWITSFPKLKYLSSNGFQNLTSLEFLLIDDCPNLTSLPNLPSSLLRLYIEDCPLLKKHCKRHKGKEWSKIADISRVTIDGKFIYDPEEKESEYDAEEESEDYS